MYPFAARADSAQGSVSAASDGQGNVSLAWLVRPDLLARRAFRIVDVRSSSSTLVATVRQGDPATAGAVSPQDFQAAQSLGPTFDGMVPADRPRIGALVAMKMISDPAFARAAGFGALLHGVRPGPHHYRIEADGGVAFESAAIDSQVATPLPPAPTGIRAANVDGGVALGWDPPARGGSVPVASYRVERMSNGDAVPLTATPLVTGINWAKGRTLLIDRTAPSGAVVTYRVRARDALGRESSATTFAFEPVNIRALRPIVLKAALRDGAVALSWTPRSDPQTAGYVLERSTMLGGPYQSLTPGTSLPARVGSYVDRTATIGNAPFYRIRMVSPRGDVGAPSPATVPGVISGVAPAPPVGVSAQAQRARVVLKWDAGGYRVAGYFVERSNDFNGKWTRMNSVLTPFENFVDTIGTHAAGTLQYRVIAVGLDEKFSAPSTVAVATLADQRPAADVIISGTTSSNGIVHVTFAPLNNGRPPARYIVYRAGSAVSTQTAVAGELPSGARSVDDTSQIAGGRSWYRVVGLDENGRRGRLSTGVAATVEYNDIPAVAAPSATYESGRIGRVRLHFAPAPPHLLLAIQVRANGGRWRWLFRGVSNDGNAYDLAPPAGGASYRVAATTLQDRSGPWSAPALVAVPKR